MESARAELHKLKSQVEFERCLRRKAESLSQVLAQELSEERARKEAMERTCAELAEAVVKEREEAGRVAEAMEEERRRMRVAEVMREERVRMELSNARVMMEERLNEIEAIKMNNVSVRGRMRKGRSVSIVRGLYGVFDIGFEGEVVDDCFRRRVIEDDRPSSSSSSAYVSKRKDQYFCLKGEGTRDVIESVECYI